MWSIKRYLNGQAVAADRPLVEGDQHLEAPAELQEASDGGGEVGGVYLSHVNVRSTPEKGVTDEGLQLSHRRLRAH